MRKDLIFPRIGPSESKPFNNPLEETFERRRPQIIATDHEVVA